MLAALLHHSGMIWNQCHLSASGDIDKAPVREHVSSEATNLLCKNPNHLSYYALNPNEKSKQYSRDKYVKVLTVTRLLGVDSGRQCVSLYRRHVRERRSGKRVTTARRQKQIPAGVAQHANLRSRQNRRDGGRVAVPLFRRPPHRAAFWRSPLSEKRVEPKDASRVVMSYSA